MTLLAGRVADPFPLAFCRSFQLAVQIRNREKADLDGAFNHRKQLDDRLTSVFGGLR